MISSIVLIILAQYARHLLAPKRAADLNRESPRRRRACIFSYIERPKRFFLFFKLGSNSPASAWDYGYVAP